MEESATTARNKDTGQTNVLIKLKPMKEMAQGRQDSKVNATTVERLGIVKQIAGRSKKIKQRGHQATKLQAKEEMEVRKQHQLLIGKTKLSS